jgi:hypothetical protein
MPGFREALEFARTNEQIGIWDRGDASCLLAVWDDERELIVPLDDEQSRSILLSDEDVCLQCRKWRAITQAAGRFIVIDEARCRAFLAQQGEGSNQ